MLNLELCFITILKPLLNILTQTQIEDLNLNKNIINEEEFEELCILLPQSKIKTLHVEKCSVQRNVFEKHCSNLNIDLKI